MDGVIITRKRRISHPKGDILHVLKSTDRVFQGFGEAYFSQIVYGEIKGWKKHTKMVSNLVVPVGKVEFVIFHEKNGTFKDMILSPEDYALITIFPGLWFAFRGLSPGLNLVLNIANMEHDPQEAVNKPLDFIPYSWPRIA